MQHNIEIKKAIRIQGDDDLFGVEHEHLDMNHISFILIGKGKYRIGDYISHILPPELIIVPKGIKHETLGKKSKFYFDTLEIKFSCSEKIHRELLSCPFRIPVAPDSYMVKLLSRIINEFLEKRYEYEKQTSLLAESLILEIKRYVHERDKIDSTFPKECITYKDIELLQRIIYKMNIEYAKPHKIENLAKEIYMAESTFTRKFTAYKGVSPMAWIISRRIEIAKSLLDDGNFAIKEIADITGFSSIHYFSRMFKKNTGHSPRKWQRLNEMKAFPENHIGDTE